MGNEIAGNGIIPPLNLSNSCKYDGYSVVGRPTKCQAFVLHSTSSMCVWGDHTSSVNSRALHPYFFPVLMEPEAIIYGIYFTSRQRGKTEVGTRCQLLKVLGLRQNVSLLVIFTSLNVLFPTDFLLTSLLL